MYEKCLFCSFVVENGENVIYQDKNVTIFHDLRKDFKVHLLIIPNRHI